MSSIIINTTNSITITIIITVILILILITIISIIIIITIIHHPSSAIMIVGMTTGWNHCNYLMHGVNNPENTLKI